MKQRNVFTKGIIDDLALNHVRQDNWVFPTHNIRIYNKRGQGYVISTMPGNSTMFSISDGFIVLAAIEHRGIVYLVTVKLVGEIWFTEIGCYPYPNAWIPIVIDSSLTGFSNIYGVLRNYGEIAPTKMHTNLFGYHNESKLKLVIDDAFDESANLYLCDGENIDKVVNSGFKSDGVVNNKFYSSDDFNGELNHILFSIKPPYSDSIQIENGGSFRPGNYFLFFRYETSSFDYTDFFPGIFPISMFDGDTLTTVVGQFNTSSDGSQNYTSKKLTVLLSSLDEAFTYLRVGLIHYYSGENGVTEYSAYLISERFKVQSIISSGKITLFGNEDEEVLTLSDIVLNQLTTRISGDHIIANQRMFKANMRSFIKDKTALKEYALRITIKEDTSPTPIPDKLYTDIVDNADRDIFGYQDPSLIESNLGYLPMETYPFSVIGLYTDGTFSEAHSIKGSDGLKLGASSEVYPGVHLYSPNDKGLYRFKELDDEFIMQPVFRFTEANLYYQQNIERFSDLKGIYIVRSDRLKNFICEGYLSPTSAGCSLIGNPVSAWNMADSADDAYHIPSEPTSRSALPPNTLYSWTPRRWDNLGNVFNDTGISYITSNRFALFSPDGIFNPVPIINNNQGVFIRVHSKNIDGVNNQLIYKDGLDLDPPTYQQDHRRGIIPGVDNLTGKAYFIEKGTYKGEARFSSYVEDGLSLTHPDGSAALYAWREASTSAPGNFSSNRSLATPSYIGLVTDDYYSYLGGALATLYVKEPTESSFADDVSFFNESNALYFQISNLIPIDNATDVKCSKGDNFIQRTWLRTSRHVDKYVGAGPDANGIDYNHGRLVSFMASSTVNSVLRNFISTEGADNSNVLYSFFPSNLSLYPNPANWIYVSDNLNVLAESLQMNHGYNKTESERTFIGFDVNLPIDSEAKSTRIAFSEKFIAEAFFDAYRRIGSESYQDYSTNNGAIIRIFSLLDIFLSIREKSIERHFLGQKKQTASEEEVVLSPVSIYLSDETSIIGYYGIQDWHAVVLTKNALYGVDYNNEMIWAAKVNHTESGRRSAGTALLSRQFKIEKKTKKFLATLNSIRKTPIVMDGISLGFNENFAEVYFTFINGTVINTLVYNEALGFFIDSCDIEGSLYIPYKKDVLSLCNSSSALAEQVQLNDVEAATTIFNGVERDNILSFVVNGNTEEENSVILTKIFESLEILCPHTSLLRIDYETELQTGSYTFSEDSAQFWKDAEWREGKWFIPIIREQEDARDAYYGEDSVLRGRWLKVSLYFRAGVDFYISDIISIFTQSFS